MNGAFLIENLTVDILNSLFHNYFIIFNPQGRNMTDDLRRQVNIYIFQIAKGSEHALESLSRAISGRMMSVALSILHDRGLAEDALQESFLKIVQKAHTFSSGDNGYAWICKIVQNVSLNILRTERRRKTVNIDECFSLAMSDDVFERSRSSVDLANGMKTLTMEEQSIIYQRYFMDFTIRDIAKSTGKSKSYVQRLLVTAEEKLRNSLNSGTKEHL